MGGWAPNSRWARAFADDDPWRTAPPSRVAGATDKLVDVLVTYHADAADAEAYRALVESLPHHARELGCWGLGGYVPKVDWVLKIYEASPTYERATDTEQWVYYWRNVEQM